MTPILRRISLPRANRARDLWHLTPKT